MDHRIDLLGRFEEMDGGKDQRNRHRRGPAAEGPRRQPQSHAAKEEFFNHRHHDRSAGDAENFPRLGIGLHPIHARPQIAQAQKNHRSQSQDQPRHRIPPAAGVFFQSELGHPPDVQPEKQGHQQDNGRHLRRAAEISVKRKPDRPVEQPEQRRRQKRRHQDDHGEIQQDFDERMQSAPTFPQVPRSGESQPAENLTVRPADGGPEGVLNARRLPNRPRTVRHPRRQPPGKRRFPSCRRSDGKSARRTRSPHRCNDR